MVMTSPAFNVDLRVALRIDDSPIIEFVAQTGVDTLDVAVPLRACGRDRSGLEAYGQS
jgi:hypothetical protein